MKKLILLLWLTASAFTLPDSAFQEIDLIQSQSVSNILPYTNHAHVNLHERIVEGTKQLYRAQYFTGTTYYFSSSGITGNTGLSISSPWPWSKVSTVGVAGDSLLFKKGDTFSGTLTYTHSGSSGNPIIFDLYGTATNNAIIDGAAETTSALFTVSANYVAVNNLIIQNARHLNGLLYLTTGVHDVTVYNCHFNTGKRGINAVNCGTSGVANLSFTYNYFTNIFDDLQTSGSVGNTFGGGSHIQLNNCTGAGIEIAYNNFYVPSPSSGNNNNYGVGDVVSLYKDNGTSASNILVHDNNFRGASNNQVTGYIWITMGDAGGSYQHVYNNIGVNGDPASQGGFSIMPSGGTNIVEENNKSYCIFSTNTHNAVGMGFAGVGSSCTVQNNHLTWYAYGKGGNPYNKWFDTGSYTTPIGWSTNTGDTAVDPLATSTMLPDPLWTGTPWNTATTPLSFGTLPLAPVGTADYSPGAVSSSNQGITYTSSNTAVATIVSGKIHLVAAGTANITANDQFDSITQPLTVTSSAGVTSIKRKVIAL